VLFFGVTGLTLNHPTWTFGDDPRRTTVTGDLPTDSIADDGTIDYLAVSEFIRATHDVRGAVSSYGAAGGTRALISYRNPGYGADLTFDTTDRSYSLAISEQGWVAAMNDLHKGRDTDDGWRWVIDVAAVFLIVVSITGLTLQFVLRRRRTAALMVAALGAIAAITLAVVTLR
jgi:uncharacterized protein